MGKVEFKDLGILWLTDNLTVVNGELVNLKIALAALDDPSSWYGRQISRVIKVKEQYVKILEKEIALG